jgi:hypothetical protein
MRRSESEFAVTSRLIESEATNDGKWQPPCHVRNEKYSFGNALVCRLFPGFNLTSFLEVTEKEGEV